MQLTLAISGLTPAAGAALSGSDQGDGRTRQRQCLRTTLVHSGRVLFSQGDNQRFAIELIEGVIRAVQLSESGSREILGFFWPGTVIRPSRATGYRYSAEAVTASRVRHPLLTPADSEYPGFCGAE